MIKTVYADFREYFTELKAQNIGFYAAAAYLVFSYLRPQVTFTFIDFLPWTQLSILVGLGWAFSQGKLRFQSSHFLVLLFAGVVVMSAVNSQYPEISERKLDVIFIWFLEVLFFTNCVSNLRQFRLLMILYFLILFKMSFFGARTWVERGFGFTKWGIAGPDGFFANSGEFSLLMAMFAILAIGYLSGDKARRVYYLTVVTATMTVLAASSRGGQLALILGGLYYGLRTGGLRPKQVLMIACLLFVVVNILPEAQKKRFSTMGDDDTSTSRLTYWSAGLEMLDEYPLFGVGFYCFPQYYHDYYKPPDQEGYLARRKEVSHNSFIEAGSSLGYPGLILYTLMIIHCFRLTNKTRKLIKRSKEMSDKDKFWGDRFSIALNGALIAYVGGSFFMFVVFYTYIYLQLMFVQAFYTSVKEVGNRKTGLV